jgi:hypothetical protein
VYDRPEYINKTIAMIIAADIINMDDVFGSPCFDFAIF